jgi:hypothetical protein
MSNLTELKKKLNFLHDLAVRCANSDFNDTKMRQGGEVRNEIPKILAKLEIEGILTKKLAADIASRVKKLNFGYAGAIMSIEYIQAKLP